MKPGDLKAKVVPWSSVVGNAITLHDKAGAVVSMLYISPDVSARIKDKAELREWAEALAAHVADAINAKG